MAVTQSSKTEMWEEATIDAFLETADNMPKRGMEETPS